jgi:ketosteroid isomerase-like protein
MSQSHDSGELVRRMVEAFNRDDVEAVIAAFDEDCEIMEPPEMPDSPDVGYRGHAGVRDWMANLRGVASAGFEPRRFESSGESVLCELASTGLGQASGVPVEWITYAVFALRGEKIARIEVFLSRAEALEAAQAGGQGRSGS